MVSRDERRIARELVDAKRAREGGRTRQIPHVSVELDSGENAGLVDAATNASDARALSEVQAVQLGDLTDVGDNAVVDATFLPERMAPGVESAGAAFEVAVAAAERVVTALEAAQQAIDEAADAKTTSNGKNSRRRGSTQPEPPPGGWVQGDQWVVDNAEGVPVEVRVWDGAEFVPEQILAAELLVLSSGGVVRLADGVVTADAIAADAIDGMVITGATIRTAASGQRWQIDASGIRGFDAAGTQTVVLTPDGSGVSINGGLLAKKARTGGGEHTASLFDGNLILATRKGGPLSSPVNVAEFWSDNEDGLMLGEYDDGLAYIYGASPDRYLTIRTGLTEHLIDANRRIRFVGAVAFQGDTEWSSLAISGGTGTLEWRRFNGQVYLRGSVLLAAAIQPGATVYGLSMLPVEARPTVPTPLLATINAVVPATGIAHTGGRIDIRNTGTEAHNSIRLSGSWFTD